MNDIGISRDNRVFFVGLNTGLITNGLPDDRYIEFYKQRSSSDLYCAIIGNVVIPGGHGSNKSTPTLSSDNVWAKVAEAIRVAGTLPGIQLATAWAGYNGSRKFVADGGHETIDHARQLVRELGSEVINKTLEAFHAAAALAVEHGFRHIQVHAAHGYLPNLLLDDRINPNAEWVRDSFASLAMWLRSQQVESSLRISMRTGDTVFDLSGTEAFQDTMIVLPFDFVDLTSGFYNIDKRLIYPSRPEFTEMRFHESLLVAARHPTRQFILSGRIAARRAELPSNAHLGICRDLIANPRFLSDESVGCRNHGKCHYYSRGSDHVTCPQWGAAK